MFRKSSVALSVGGWVCVSLLGSFAQAQHQYRSHHYPAHALHAHQYPAHRYRAHHYRQHRFQGAVGATSSAGATSSGMAAPMAVGGTGGIPGLSGSGLPSGLQDLLPALPGFSDGQTPGFTGGQTPSAPAAPTTGPASLALPGGRSTP